jgi:hypothetical protein
MTVPPRSALYAPPGQKLFVGTNRGALRGYVWIAAAGFAVLAYLAWPNLLWLVVLLGVGILLACAGLWMQWSLSAGDRDAADSEDSELGREPQTGELD